MKHFYYLAFFIAIVLIGQIANGQDPCSSNNQLQLLSGRLFNNYFLQYKGNPYLINRWMTGDIEMVGGEVVKGVMVKLDIYNDEMVYYHEKLKRVFIIDKGIIAKARLKDSLGDNLNIVKLSTDIGSKFGGFYIQLVDDDIALFFKPRKLLELNNSDIPSDGKIGSFYRRDHYYMNNETFQQVSLRKRKMLKQFPKHKKELSKFITKNRLRLKNQHDLTKVFKAINQFVPE